ncbi:MAG: DUF5615 family PIN-like protein [Candidatus Hydrogenedentota bacterium]
MDENIGGLASAEFRESNHDVSSIAEQRMCSALDPEVIAACQGEGRCLVTLDKEFGNPLVYPPSRYARIAVLRVPAPMTIQRIRDAVTVLLSALRKDSIDGKLWIVHRHRVRKYAPGE